MTGAPDSKVELAKRRSRHLRGTIAETLASDRTHFGHDDLQLLKFHGTYQQDDRDTRRELEAAGLEKAYAFMVRVAVPAGAVTARGACTISPSSSSSAPRWATPSPTWG